VAVSRIREVGMSKNLSIPKVPAFHFWYNRMDNFTLHMSWIDKCMEERHKLNDWERKFIIDIRLQLRSKGSLSDKQVQILERIYADKTS